MKKTALLLIALLPSLSFAQQTYEQLTYPDGKVFLEYRFSESKVKDQEKFEKKLISDNELLMPIKRIDYINSLCKENYKPASELWIKIINEDKSATYKYAVEITKKNADEINKSITGFVVIAEKKVNFYRKICTKK